MGDKVDGAWDHLFSRRPDLKGMSAGTIRGLAKGDRELSNLMADVVLAWTEEDPDYAKVIDEWAEGKLTQ